MGITQENCLVVDLSWVFRGIRPWQAHPRKERHLGPKGVLQYVGTYIVETTALQFLPIRCAGKVERTLSIRPKRNQQRAKGYLYHLTAAVDRIFPGFLEQNNAEFRLWTSCSKPFPARYPALQPIPPDNAANPEPAESTGSQSNPKTNVPDVQDARDGRKAVCPAASKHTSFRR